MNDTEATRGVEELVALPDPAVQPLVHPLDLPEARGHFRRALLLRMLCEPPAALCIAALVWFASRNILAPVLAGAALIGFGALAATFERSEAWAFIPRKRQDRSRPLPLTWEIGASVVFAALLAGVLLLMARELGRSAVPGDVREFTFGMAAATAALVAGDAAIRFLRGPQRRRAALALPAVMAVAGSVTSAGMLWFDGGVDWSSSMIVWGAATMLAIGAAAGIWRTIETRRSPDG